MHCCRMLADLLIGLIELTRDSLSRRALLPAGEVEAQLSLIKPMYKVCGRPPSSHLLKKDECKQ